MALDLLTTIELDMQNPYSSSSIVHVNQYDTAGRIKAQLLNGGVKWQVPQGAKPVVMFKKTDNIGGFYDVTELNPSTAAVTVDGSDSSIIYITLDQQTTTTATPTGQYVNMQVAFYQNSARLSTFAFHMQVAESVVTSGDIHSNWLFNILSQEIAQILTDATTPEFIEHWLEENITQETGYVIDDSLTIHGAASDAQATGKMVTVSDTNPGISANKVWVKKTPSEIVVPTEDEVEDLRNTINALMFSGIEKYNGALGAINTDVSADRTKIYISTSDLNEENNNRLMVYSETDGAWVYYGSYKFSALFENTFATGTMLDIMQKLLFSKFERYDGALGIIKSDATANTNKIYIATTKTSNNNRLMIHNGVDWEYFGDYTINEVIYNDSIMCLDAVMRLVVSGYERYSGSLDMIKADSSANKQTIYISTSVNAETNDRIMFYDGSEWKYLGEYKLTDLLYYSQLLKESVVRDIVLQRLNLAVLNYPGALYVINGDATVDKKALYIANTEDANNNKVMYYDTNRSAWVFTSPVIYKTDIQGYINAGVYQARDYALDLIFSRNIEDYNAGLGTIQQDANADINNLYIAHTNTANNLRIMYHNGISWAYLGEFKTTDFSQAIALVRDALVYGGVDTNTLEGLSDVLGYNRSHKFFNFAFFTDTHSNVQNAEKSKNIMNSFQSLEYFDAYVHGGDLITTYSMDIENYIAEMTTYSKDYKRYGDMFFAKGNHDNNHSDDPTEDVTNAQYRLVMQTQMHGAQFNASDDDSCYYYVDYPIYKIRMIVLDAFDNYADSATVSFNNKQKAWLYGTALDVRDGWTVIVISHAVPNANSNCENILKAFNDRGTQYGDYIFSDASITTHFVGLIHGHTHIDEYTNAPGFNEIGTVCGYTQGGAVDVFTVDTVAKKLYVTRFGSGNARGPWSYD